MLKCNVKDPSSEKENGNSADWSSLLWLLDLWWKKAGEGTKCEPKYMIILKCDWVRRSQLKCIEYQQLLWSSGLSYNVHNTMCAENFFPSKNWKGPKREQKNRGWCTCTSGRIKKICICTLRLYYYIYIYYLYILQINIL